MTRRPPVAVPVRFYDDHVGRGLPNGVELNRTARTVTVQLDDEAFNDLLSDARFYVEMGVAEFGRDMLGLIRSAQATVTRLEAVR